MNQSELIANTCSRRKCGKTRVRKSQLVLVLLLIDWESGARFFQPITKAKPKKSRNYFRKPLYLNQTITVCSLWATILYVTFDHAIFHEIPFETLSSLNELLGIYFVPEGCADWNSNPVGASVSSIPLWYPTAHEKQLWVSVECWPLRCSRESCLTWSGGCARLGSSRLCLELFISRYLKQVDTRRGGLAGRIKTKQHGSEFKKAENDVLLWWRCQQPGKWVPFYKSSNKYLYSVTDKPHLTVNLPTSATSVQRRYFLVPITDLFNLKCQQFSYLDPHQGKEASDTSD